MLTKLALLAITLTLAPAVYAVDCLGDLCVGDVVIDSSDRVGQVSGIRRNQIDYVREGQAYTITASPGALSEKVVSATFPVNSFVMDSSDLSGRVRHAFSDGRVQYVRDGQNYHTVASNVVPAVASYNGIAAQMHVVDSSDLVGVVRLVFRDGRVQYVRQGQNYYSTSKNVSPAVGALNGLATGVRVIDSSDVVGTVRLVFQDGRAQYQRDQQNYLTVATNLVPAIPSANNVSTGTKVLDSSNLPGVALLAFNDGRIQYQRYGQSYKTVASNLAYEVATSRDGIRTGTRVLDTSDLPGLAVTVYHDGRILYSRIGQSYLTVSTNLAREVDTHAEYSRGVVYATSSRRIGEPLHFYSDGRIELTDGLVASRLFAEVSELSGVAAGSEVVTPLHTVVVSKIFANATISYEIEDRTVVGRLLSAEDIARPELRTQWLTALIDAILDANRVWHNDAVTSQDYLGLLRLLEADLEIPNNRHFTGDELRLLREHVQKELARLQSAAN